MNYGHWRGNAKMVRAFVDKSGETIDWMQANGVKFEKLFSNYPNGLYTWHIYEGRGAGWINLFQQKYKDAGQTLLLNTWGKELIQDKNGTVKGVVATNKNGDKITVNAKATIIATGGFFDNKEMREKYLRFPDADGLAQKGKTGDGIGDYRPTNKYKMIRLRWVIARKELHDMLGICSWTAPWELSPLRERGYIGDIEMESKVFKAVTGISMTQDELDKAGLRAFLLQRLYTMRQLKTKDMRHVHDRYPDWIFDDAKGRAPFTKGTIRMEHDDIEKSFDLFFELMDFDVKTGAPTEKCLNEYGLAKAVPVMKKEGLL